MRRHLILILIFLLAGAVVNVAVAWGCAIQGWSGPTDLRFADGNYRGVRAGWVLTLQSSDAEWIFEAMSGWPMLAMNYRSTDGGRAGGTIVADVITINKRTVLGPDAFPLRPIWPGFAANTVFYAAILWLLIPGPFVLRRFVRQRRGLCPACAYPMGLSSTCTECGKPLPGRAVA